MRYLRSFAALLTIAAITVACAASPGSGGQSQGAEPSTGSQSSQAAASAGGGGGGGGANGSISYEITGDYTASGELPFLTLGLSQWVDSAGGWLASFANQDGSGAYIQLNTQAAEGTAGQSFSYGDGKVILVAASGDSGMGCTFNLTKNDSSGLSGDLTCTSAIAADVTTGAQKHVQVTAHWDAHP